MVNREVPTQLLERVDALALLEESLAAVKSGASGRLVLVAGEAGVGKTALLRRFREEQRALRILWGSCDPLFMPRPLGPLLDIAELTGGELAQLVRGKSGRTRSRPSCCTSSSARADNRGARGPPLCG